MIIIIYYRIKHAVGLKQDREEALNRVVVHMWSAAAMETVTPACFSW